MFFIGFRCFRGGHGGAIGEQSIVDHLSTECGEVFLACARLAHFACVFFAECVVARGAVSSDAGAQIGAVAMTTEAWFVEIVHDTVQVGDDFGEIVARLGGPINEEFATVGATVDGPPCDLMVIVLLEEKFHDDRVRISLGSPEEMAVGAIAHDNFH